MFDDDYVFRADDMPDLPDVPVGCQVFEAIKSRSEDEAALMTEVETGRKCTSLEFLQLSANAAVALRKSGIVEGNHVCIIGKNTIDTNVIAAGCLFIGAVFAPLDPSMTKYEFQHIFSIIVPSLVACDTNVLNTVRGSLNDANVEAQVITLQDNEESLDNVQNLIQETSLDNFEPSTNVGMNDLCFIVCSSGTTGLPKAVGLSQKNVRFMLFIEPFGVCRIGGFLHISNFFWVSAVALFFATTYLGLKVVIVTHVTVTAIFEAIQNFKPLSIFCSPAMAEAITNHPDLAKYDLSSLRLFFTGGSILPKSTIARIKEVWKQDLVVGQGYGMSELCAFYLAARPDLDVNSVGTPSYPGTAMKIVDLETGKNLPPGKEGEIYCQSPGIMKGYINDAEATAAMIDEDGWLHSGDLGFINENGLVYITGRIKEMMKLENHQVSPAEIEGVILGVPGVVDVGVTGIQVSEDSSHPMALVVRVEGSDVSEEDIAKRVNDTLSEFKHLKAGICFVDSLPRTITETLSESKQIKAGVWFVASLPRTETGKLKRKLLKDIEDEICINRKKIELENTNGEFK